MKKRTKKNFKESVHYSIKNRKAYKRNMLLILLALIVVLCGCAACFTFGNVTWNPDEGFTPVANPKNWWQILIIVVGAVVSVGSLVGYFFICYNSFRKFYSTQEVYWKSAEFKKRKAEALKVELFKLKAKDLKWYKKMGYITSDQLKNAKEEQTAWIKECKAKKEKVNYAKAKA